MVSVEKTSHRNKDSAHYHRPSVGFIVNPDEDHPEGVRIELISHDPQESTIRMLDEWGRTLMQESEGFGNEKNRLEFTVRNLEAGTYFFEMSDGFFYQVKEVRIPPEPQ